MAIMFDIGFRAETRDLKSSLKAISKEIQTAISAPSGQGLSKEISAAVTQAGVLQKALQKATSDKGISYASLNAELAKAGTSAAQMVATLSAAGPQFSGTMNTFLKSISQADRSLLTITSRIQTFGHKMAQAFSYSLLQDALQMIVNGLSSAVSWTERLDTALNQIQIVSAKTASQMETLYTTTVEKAKELRVAAADYAQAQQIFYQQGLGDDEVQRRADITVKSAQAAGESVNQMSKELTAIWNTYRMADDELERAASIAAKLGANSAIAFKDIAEAMQVAASPASQMGVSYESLAAIIATVGETTLQSASVIGNAYKTIFSRFEQLKSAGTDGEVTLGQVSQQIKDLGFDILDSAGNLKPLEQVINEVGEAWDTLSQKQQIALAEVVGGTRQYGQALALFQNWDRYLELLGDAQSENGAETLERQYETALESIDSKMTNAAEAWSRAFSEIFTEDGIKGFYSALETVGNLMDSILKSAGGVQGVLVIVGGLLVSKVLKSLNSIKSLAGDIVNGFSTKGQIKSITKEFAAMDAQLQMSYEQRVFLTSQESEMALNTLNVEREKIEISRQVAETQAYINKMKQTGNAETVAAAEAEERWLQVAQENLLTAVDELNVIKQQTIEEKRRLELQKTARQRVSGLDENQFLKTNQGKILLAQEALNKAVQTGANYYKLSGEQAEKAMETISDSIQVAKGKLVEFQEKMGLTGVDMETTTRLISEAIGGLNTTVLSTGEGFLELGPLFSQAASQIGSRISQLKIEFKNLKQDESFEQNSKAISQQIGELERLQGALQSTARSFEQIGEAQKRQAAGNEQLKDSLERLKAMMTEIQNMSWGKILSQSASSLGMMAISLSSLGKELGSAEKDISSMIISLTMAGTAIAMFSRGVFNLVSKLYMMVAAEEAAATAATVLKIATGGIVAAIGIAITAFTFLAQAERESRDAAYEQADAFVEEQGLISSLKEEVNDLMNKTSLTTEEKESLRNKTLELAEALGIEDAAVRLLKDGYDALLESIDAAQMEAQRKSLRPGGDLSNAREAAIKDFNDNNGWGQQNYSIENEEERSIVKAAFNKVDPKQEGIRYGEYSDKNGMHGSMTFYDVDSGEKALLQLEAIKEAYSDLVEAGLKDTGIAKKFKEIIDAESETEEKLKDIVKESDTFSQSVAKWDLSKSGLSQNTISSYENYVNYLEKYRDTLNEVSEEEYSLEEANNILANSINLTTFSAQWNEINKLSESYSNLGQIIQRLSGEQQADIADLVSAGFFSENQLEAFNSIFKDSDINNIKEQAKILGIDIKAALVEGLYRLSNRELSLTDLIGKTEKELTSLAEQEGINVGFAYQSGFRSALESLGNTLKDELQAYHELEEAKAYGASAESDLGTQAYREYTQAVKEAQEAEAIFQQVKIDGNEVLRQSSEDATKAANNAQEFAEKNLKIAKAAADVAKELEAEEDEIIAIAKAFAEANDKLDANSAAQAAKRYKNLNDAVSEMLDNWEDYEEAIDNFNKALARGENAQKAFYETDGMVEYRKQLAKALDTQEDFLDPERLKRYEDAFGQLIDGYEEYLPELQRLFLEDMFISVGMELNEEQMAHIVDYLNQFEEGETIVVDGEIDPLLASLIEAKAATVDTVTELQNVLSGIGITLDASDFYEVSGDMIQAAKEAGDLVVDHLSFDAQAVEGSTEQKSVAEPPAYDTELHWEMEEKPLNVSLEDSIGSSSTSQQGKITIWKPSMSVKSAAADNPVEGSEETTFTAIRMSNAKKAAGGNLSTKNTATSRGGSNTGRPSKSSGGKKGGGGSKKEDKKTATASKGQKKQLTPAKRYDNLTSAIDKVKSSLDKTNAALDEAWGGARLRQYSLANEQIERAVDLYKQLGTQAKNSWNDDKKALSSAVTESLKYLRNFSDQAVSMMDDTLTTDLGENLKEKCQELLSQLDPDAFTLTFDDNAFTVDNWQDYENWVTWFENYITKEENVLIDKQNAIYEAHKTDDEWKAEEGSWEYSELKAIEAAQDSIDSWRDTIDYFKEAVENAKSNFDETVDMINESQENLRTLLYDWFNNKLTEITEKLELRIEINERDLKQIEKLADKLGARTGILSGKMSQLLNSKQSQYEQEYKDTKEALDRLLEIIDNVNGIDSAHQQWFKDTFGEPIWDKFLENGGAMTQEMANILANQWESLYDLEENLWDTQMEQWENYLDGLDYLVDRWDGLIDKIDSLSARLDSLKEIAEITGLQYKDTSLLGNYREGLSKITAEWFGGVREAASKSVSAISEYLMRNQSGMLQQLMLQTGWDGTLAELAESLANEFITTWKTGRAEIESLTTQERDQLASLYDSVLSKVGVDAAEGQIAAILVTEQALVDEYNSIREQNGKDLQTIREIASEIYDAHVEGADYLFDTLWSATSESSWTKSSFFKSLENSIVLLKQSAQATAQQLRIRQDEFNQTKAAMEEIKAKYGDDASQWSDWVAGTYEKLEEAYYSASSDIASYQQEITDSISQIYQKALENAESMAESLGRVLQEELGGVFDTLDSALDMYSQRKDMEDFFLDDYDYGDGINQKTYELEKLMRSIRSYTKDITDQDKLNKYQAKLEEINKIKNSDKKLTQAELEILQQEFELMKAQDAYEDERNQKNTMRLSRDASGNWAYVYSDDAEEKDIEDIEQQIADAQYNIHELHRQAADEAAQMWLEMQQEYWDFEQEIDWAMYENDAKYREMVEQRRAWYREQLEIYAEEFAEHNAEIGRSQEDTTLGVIANINDLEAANKRYEQQHTQHVGVLQENYDQWMAKADEARIEITGAMETTEEYIARDTDNIVSDIQNVELEMEEMEVTTDAYLSMMENEVMNWAMATISYFEDVIVEIRKYEAVLAEALSQSNSTDFSRKLMAITAKETGSTSMTVDDVYKRYEENKNTTWGEEMKKKLAARGIESEEEIKAWISNALDYTSDNQAQRAIPIYDLNNETLSSQWNNTEYARSVNISGQIASDMLAAGILNVDSTREEKRAAFNDAFNANNGYALAYLNKLGIDTSGKSHAEIAAMAATEAAERVSLPWVASQARDAIIDGTLQAATGGLITKRSLVEVAEEGKELILNTQDTSNILKAVTSIRGVSNNLDAVTAAVRQLTSINTDNSSSIDQKVEIKAEFPNVSVAAEIEQALNNIVNQSIQYAHSRY